MGGVATQVMLAGELFTQRCKQKGFYLCSTYKSDLYKKCRLKINNKLVECVEHCGKYREDKNLEHFIHYLFQTWLWVPILPTAFEKNTIKHIKQTPNILETFQTSINSVFRGADSWVSLSQRIGANSMRHAKLISLVSWVLKQEVMEQFV